MFLGDRERVHLEQMVQHLVFITNFRLGETDDILADIMADISDFSAQLDNMF